MKRKIIIATFILLFVSIFIKPVFAKYVVEENIIAANIQIDRTSPKADIKYSTKELTEGVVEVTIQANEEIKNIEGWGIQSDKKTLKKQYDKNIKEQVVLQDLSGNTKTLDIEISNIDNITPSITIAKQMNTNNLYPNYANKDAQITLIIELKDDRKIEKILQEQEIKILVEGKEIIPKIKKLETQKDTATQKILLLTLSGIEEEGTLSLQIPEGAIQDEIGHKSAKVEYNTKIQIDNTKPQATYSQKKIEKGKVEFCIIANEEVRKLDGWDIEENKTLKKIFLNNLSYKTNIQDLAGNSIEVEINIKEATNILLSYASHNSAVGWSYGYGNYDIAGAEAIKENAKYKTESLAFSILGNVDKDYLQAKAFVYTNWGEGSKAKCDYTNKIYSYGWNPSNSSWKYETEENKITLNGMSYFQLGGAGVNAAGNTDLNGNGEISRELMQKFRYGISGIALKLKSENENSIIYQIYVDGVGWLEPAKNGEITSYQLTKPISAIRVALVPNSEVTALISTWNLDTGNKL